MKGNIVCYSVKTTIHIDTEKEYTAHDCFELDECDAKAYVKIQEHIGNKLDTPWGKFKVEIIPLITQESIQ